MDNFVNKPVVCSFLLPLLVQQFPAGYTGNNLFELWRYDTARRQIMAGAVTTGRGSGEETEEQQLLCIHLHVSTSLLH